MNCIEVTNAIWSGVSSADLEAHLEVCTVCQKERETKRLLFQNMRELVEVPKPSRSLLPDQDEIKRAVKRNRYADWLKRLGRLSLGREGPTPSTSE
ncbi:MAG TPA: hypothetical protein VFV52_01915 [Bacilli bacterium]|nr:hypothetical protein [Bacilli bacterium]